MKIKSFLGGFDKNFSYLIWCDKTKYAAIIDPAVEPIKILEYIEGNQLVLTKILITHSHYDHIKYLDDYLFKYPNIQICCFEEAAKLYKNNNLKGLVDNEVIALGEILIIVLYTPGHYYDSICFWIKNENCIFTGDTIFVGRTGRTKSKTSDISKLYESVYKKILTLPDKTEIYPGHHYGHIPTITIKKNKEISDFFQCNSLNEFIEVMKNFESNR